jgi:hypothetical protein
MHLSFCKFDIQSIPANPKIYSQGSLSLEYEYSSNALK